MNIKSIGILFLVLILLGSWYYFYDVKGKKERERAEIEAKRLFGNIEPDSVTSFETKRMIDTDNLPENISISPEDTSYSLSFIRNGTVWYIEKPVNTLADNDNVSALIKKIVELQAERKIPSSSKMDLRIYGLDKPGFIIRFKTKDTSHECRLGNENPTNQYFYVQYDSSEDIVLVPSDIKSLLTKKLYYYREKHALLFDEDNVRKLRYTVTEHAPIELVKKGDDWYLTAPREAEGDRYRIDDLITALQQEKAHEFVQETPDSEKLVEYGLDKPHIRIDLWEGEHDTLHTLRIGKHSDDSGKFRYAMRSGFNPIFTVSKELTEKFSTDPFTYQSKEVCRFQRDTVHTIHIHHADESFTIERDDEGDWHIVQPEKIPTDSTAVGGFLSDLSYLKATGIKPDDVSFGSSRIKIDLSDEQGNPVQTLTIGDSAKELSGYWVKTSSSDTIFRISDSDVTRLDKHASDFRDRTIFSFKRPELDKITITKDHVTLSFKPEGDIFRVIEPESGSYSQDILSELAWTLNPIRMDMLSDVTDNKQTGLDHPVITVTVFEKDTTPKILLFGKQTPDKQHIYVRTGSPGPVYLVNIDSIRPLLELK